MGRLRGAVRLVCRDCGNEKDYDRSIDPNIPNECKMILSECPGCNAGDFGTEVWLDVRGCEIDQSQPKLTRR